MGRNESAASAYLEPGERTVVQLDGVVSGYTRWSGVGGLMGILLALAVPRALDLNFVLGVLSIVVVVTAVFLLVYYYVGRRLAARSTPPSQSPYVTVMLTDRRVLLLDRDLGADDPTLVEQTANENVSSVRHNRAGPLVPHRLEYVVDGGEPRKFEFPRSQPVAGFVAHFE
ncbi:MAG: hypothetical protein QNJ81_04125 [Acidimicrobiia bacterium]|nr:hypothetical protein [Acidimicrobiia bacterium]